MIHRNSQGEFARKGFTSLERHLILFIILAIVAGYTWQEIKPVQATTSPVEPAGCVETSPNEYSCTDALTQAKWVKYLEEKNKELEDENGELKGKPYSVSMYSRKDSCHNRVGDKCLTAGGRDVKEGWTVACPRSVALGTVVTIEGFGSRTCDDRTAQWVEDKFGGTFDVFTEDYELAKKFGRKTLNVIIQ